MVVAGPEKRAYHLVLHERPEGWDITAGAARLHARGRHRVPRREPDDYAGMVITGGRAPEYLRYDADLMRITRRSFAANKPVASVCHGIEIMAAADVIRGKR